LSVKCDMVALARRFGSPPRSKRPSRPSSIPHGQQSRSERADTVLKSCCISMRVALVGLQSPCLCNTTSKRYPALSLREDPADHAGIEDGREAVLIERGPKRVPTRPMSHLTLNAENIAPWLAHHEIPAPFYVDVGEMAAPFPVWSYSSSLRFSSHATD